MPGTTITKNLSLIEYFYEYCWTHTEICILLFMTISSMGKIFEHDLIFFVVVGFFGFFFKVSTCCSSLGLFQLKGDPFTLP